VVVPAPANKGIGWDVARILAESGVKTVVAARNEELGRQAVAKLQEATGERLDVALPEVVCSCCAALLCCEAAADILYFLCLGALKVKHSSGVHSVPRPYTRWCVRDEHGSSVLLASRPALDTSAAPAPAVQHPRQLPCFALCTRRH